MRSAEVRTRFFPYVQNMTSYDRLIHQLSIADRWFWMVNTQQQGVIASSNVSLRFFDEELKIFVFHEHFIGSILHQCLWTKRIILFFNHQLFNILILPTRMTVNLSLILLSWNQINAWVTKTNLSPVSSFSLLVQMFDGNWMHIRYNLLSYFNWKLMFLTMFARFC